MSQYINFLVPLVAFTVNVLVQMISVRYILKTALLKTIFLGFTIGFFVLFVPVIYISESGLRDFLFIFLMNFIIYSCLGYCYFNFINLAVTARRIRLLWELIETKDGSSYEEIISRYNAKYMVEARLGRLLNSGQIILKDGHYFIGKTTMAMISKIMLAMKVVILGKRSEFD